MSALHNNRQHAGQLVRSRTTLSRGPAEPEGEPGPAAFQHSQGGVTGQALAACVGALGVLCVCVGHLGDSGYIFLCTFDISHLRF